MPLTGEGPAAVPPSAFLGHQTAKSAVAYLIDLNEGYHEPTRSERDALLVAFAKARKAIVGAAFDLVRLIEPIDLGDSEAIHAKLASITLCEVKSTNRAGIREDFSGYFFNITAGELLTAQALGNQYRFILVNTVRRLHVERRLQDLFAAAKAMYPAWHIRL